MNSKTRRLRRLAPLGLALILLGGNNLQNSAFAAALTPAPAPSATQTRSTEAPLGRLFMRPERRQTLDRQRILDLPPDEKKVEAPQLRLDGLVVRSGGRGTAWINGRAVSERDTASVRVTPASGRTGHARVAIPNERTHTVPVGAAVDRDTGEVKTPLGAGRVTAGAR